MNLKTGLLRSKYWIVAVVFVIQPTVIFMAVVLLPLIGCPSSLLPSFVDIESAKWKTFRRQLRSDDRERLGKVFDYARMHADSGTMVSIPHKIDVVFMSVLIEMQRRIDELETDFSKRH